MTSCDYFIRCLFTFQPLVETIQKEVKITDAGRKVTVNVQGQDIR